VADATRGEFLSLTTVGLGAMIGGVIGVPATAYLLAPVTKETTFEPAFLGDVSKFTSEQKFNPTAATFLEDPQNPNTSSSLAWVHYTGKKDTDWHSENAMFVVFSNRCMHLGCPIAATPGGFQCPCHGGVYDTNGERTGGPPIRSLDRFQWEIRNGSELWITQRWSTNIYGGMVHYYPVKMPGQPTHMPGPSWIPDVLYPHVTYTHGPAPGPVPLPKA
jgi:menaquinol-cytochrome c reductase iron-sulfur subunit